MDAFARNNNKNASYIRVYHLLNAQALTIIYTTLFLQEVVMYTLIAKLKEPQVLLEQIVFFTVSFIVANFLYKFGSFGLELIAFLATWFCIDVFVQCLKKN
jgi:hypothetical protein